MSLRRLAVVLGILIVAAVVYVIAADRNYIRDFEVYRTAAQRVLAAEPLYRSDDGFFQYKYWPVFALAMAPFALLPLEVGRLLWFGLTVGLIASLFGLSIHALPERRLARHVLAWWTLFVTGKFFVRELVNGQTNALLAVLLVGALIASQRHRRIMAGTLVGVAVFVKPYALLTVPWLLITQGAVAMAACGAVLATGLVLPAVLYGWQGNLALLAAWYGTVSSSTGETLAIHENISFASMWVKWIGAGPAAVVLTLATSAAAAGLAVWVWWRRQRSREPNYLEMSLLLLLVPLLSPQGWDYVLLLATPAFVCLIDRFGDMSRVWRIGTAAGCLLTGLMIFDLYGRTLYVTLTEGGAMSVGAILLAASLARLRARGLA